jgi:hypothetical protein
MTRWLREYLCGRRGHYFTLRSAPARLFLACLECGRETPGWALTLPAPKVKRPVLRFPVRARRVA